MCYFIVDYSFLLWFSEINDVVARWIKLILTWKRKIWLNIKHVLLLSFDIQHVSAQNMCLTCNQSCVAIYCTFYLNYTLRGKGTKRKECNIIHLHHPLHVIATCYNNISGPMEHLSYLFYRRVNLTSVLRYSANAEFSNWKQTFSCTFYFHSNRNPELSPCQRFKQQVKVNPQETSNGRQALLFTDFLQACPVSYFNSNILQS